MGRFTFRWAALALGTAVVFAMGAIADEPSNSGAKQGEQTKNQDQQAQDQSQQSQNQAQQSNQQEQKQTKETTATESRSDNAQQARSENARESNDSRNQSNARNRDQSDRESASSERSVIRDRDQDDRGSSGSRNQYRSGDRNRNDYSNRDADRSSNRSNERASRGHDSGRNMRGPDIGIWFNRSSRDGLVISDVSSKGAVAKLGFHEGDRIVSVNGRRVTREDEFIDLLIHSNRTRVEVVVFRDGREQTIIVEPAVLTREYETSYSEVDPLEQFGIIVDDRYDDRIVVWRVIPRSPAYYAGFRAGDVIVKFGDRPYRTRTEFEKGVVGWKAGDVDVQIRRGDRTRDLSVEVPKFNRSQQREERVSERMDRRESRQDQTQVDRSYDNGSDRSTRGPVRGILRGRNR
jgi:C-terminal processing protease CtpA/Prc